MGKEAFFKIARGIVQMGQRFMLDNRSKSKNFVLDKLSNLIIKNEIDIMNKLDHPNIISLYETYEDKKYIYFIMDICDGGELFEKITEKGALSENDTKDMFIQLMKAIGYMHHNGICHRDLKPENLLFVNSKNNV